MLSIRASLRPPPPRSAAVLALAMLTLGAAGLVGGCGAAPTVDKDDIRRNAEEADRDLDREAKKGGDPGG